MELGSGSKDSFAVDLGQAPSPFSTLVCHLGKKNTLPLAYFNRLTHVSTPLIVLKFIIFIM